MNTDKDHKFDLEDIVRITSGPFNGTIGSIESIRVTKRIEKDSTAIDAEYHILVERGNEYSFLESDLEPANVENLHPDRYQVKTGQIILRDNKRYVVEDTKTITGRELGWAPGFENKQFWKVYARELDSEGKYNPKNKIISFEQGDNEAIDILGKLERSYL